MRRLLGSVVVAYLVLAVTGRLAERAGVVSCHCSDGCWCQRPGLGLFRHVFPYRHSSG